VSVVVLMYHALVQSEQELQALAPGQRPYALPVSRFVRQLELLRLAGIPVLDPATLSGAPLPARGVVLTFDDGHASDHRHALGPLLLRGLRAAFFVTTGFMGRPGYCTPRAVRDLAHAGMTVGSHGVTHGFLGDMDEAQARHELALSKVQLEDVTGMPVEQLSFPGGRFTGATLGLGRELGYTLFHTSRCGSHAAGEVVAHGGTLRRMAVRSHLGEGDFLAMASAARWPLAKARATSTLKHTAQRLLGNGLYERLHGQFHA
jgi:peptidoglycan/xylan/chitin deacetylase (PgdA/CDA1 family)